MKQGGSKPAADPFNSPMGGLDLSSPSNPFDGWDNDDALKSSLTTSDPFGGPSKSTNLLDTPQQTQSNNNSNMNKYNPPTSAGMNLNMLGQQKKQEFKP